MARPTKQGLEYFPLDIDFFSDEKIEYVSARFGIKGEITLIRLLCKIYRIGYYTDWSEDECILLAKRAGDGLTPALVSEVVNELVKRRFFDESLLLRFNILTSPAIQRRYSRATAERKTIDINSDFWLIDLPKNAVQNIIRPINEVIRPINEVIRPKSTQSKVKYSKVKDNKISLSDESDIEKSERESFFEIFNLEKGINFSALNVEVERFINHYQALGWTNSKGIKIHDRKALARNWSIRPEVSCNTDTAFLCVWHRWYQYISTHSLKDARLMITDFYRHRTTDTNALMLEVSQRLHAVLEQHAQWLQNQNIYTGLQYTIRKTPTKD